MTRSFQRNSSGTYGDHQYHPTGHLSKCRRISGTSCSIILGTEHLVFDLIYNPSQTRLMQLCRIQGSNRRERAENAGTAGRESLGDLDPEVAAFPHFCTFTNSRKPLLGMRGVVIFQNYYLMTNPNIERYV